MIFYSPVLARTPCIHATKFNFSRFSLSSFHFRWSSQTVRLYQEMLPALLVQSRWFDSLGTPSLLRIEGWAPIKRLRHSHVSRIPRQDEARQCRSERASMATTIVASAESILQNRIRRWRYVIGEWFSISMADGRQSQTRGNREKWQLIVFWVDKRGDIEPPRSSPAASRWRLRLFF